MIFVTIFVIKFFISFDIWSFFWVWRSSSFWRWRQLRSYISYYLSYSRIWPFEAFLSVAHQWLARFEDGASWWASQAAAASENRLLTEFWRRRICTSRQGLVSTWAADKSRVVFLMKTSPWQSVQCWIRRWGLELKHETSYTVRRVKAKERFRTGACLLPASFAGLGGLACYLLPGFNLLKEDLRLLSEGPPWSPSLSFWQYLENTTTQVKPILLHIWADERMWHYIIWQTTSQDHSYS